MDSDDYGFCHGLEKNAVKAFNKAGLKAFAEVAREEFAKELESVKAREQGDRNTPGSFRFRQLSDVLRAIYAAQQMPTGYWPWSRPRNWLRATAQPSPGSTGRAESHMKP